MEPETKAALVVVGFAVVMVALVLAPILAAMLLGTPR